MNYDHGKRLALLAAGLAIQGVCGASPANHSGLWWNPAEAGWGVAIEEQGSVVSAVMATYDASGQPVWFILPHADKAAVEEADASAPPAFNGTYYRTNGLPQLDTCTRCGDPPLFPEQVGLTDLGNAGFVFNADGSATFMTPTSSLGAKAITPEVFASQESSSSCGGDAASSQPARYQGFWANASESGWGLYIAHQADVVFGIWLTYSANGNPLWYSMPLARGDGNSYSGPIVFSTGPAFDDPLYDASRVGAMEVGSATMSFDDANNAHLQYNLPGLYAGTRDVARQVFSESAEAATCD
jgi:hypothetical protein